MTNLKYICTINSREYARILEDISREKSLQYILATHSDALINYSTINSILRLSLDKNRYTKVNQLQESQFPQIVKILENLHSARVLFSKKVLLVEGQDDKYFYRSVLDSMYPEIKNDIYTLAVNGADNYKKWREFFTQFGLTVTAILDLDKAPELLYGKKFTLSLIKDAENINKLYSEYPDVEQRIEAEYVHGLFILKKGTLEHYYQDDQSLRKGLELVIGFCNNNLDDFLSGNSDKATEIKSIVEGVVGYSSYVE